MLKTSIKASSFRRFNGSKASVLFTPNSDFSQPHNDPEILVIPKRPVIETSKKIHHEMLSPEYISDLVLKPNFNDVFYTSLASNSPFGGDALFKLVPKDNSQPPVSVELLFSNITKNYMNAFNEQLILLTEISELPIIPRLIPRIYDLVDSKVKQVYAINSEISLNTLAQQLLLDNSHNSTINPHSLSIYILENMDDNDSQRFSEFISYISSNSTTFTNEQLKRVLEKLILKLDNINNETIIRLGCEFFKTNVNLKTILLLHSWLLDKLVKMLSKNGDTFMAHQILSQLITDLRVKPLTDTVTLFFKAHDTEITKVDFLRQVAILKPVIYSMDLVFPIVDIILRRGIDSVIELEHFLRLISQQRNERLLPEIGNSMIEKILEVSEPLTSIYVSQLLTRLLKEGVILNKSVKDQLLAFYKDSPSNLRFIKSL